MAETAHNMRPTPTENTSLQQKLVQFPTICDALDYAAGGDTGFNFFDLRGRPISVMSYGEIRDRARALARRLASRFERGSRLSIVAETSPDFALTFFACQYAGLIPAPMPLPVNLGGKDGYLTQIRQMIVGAKAHAAIGPATLKDFIKDAAQGLDVPVLDFGDVADLPEADAQPEPFGPDDVCYIQYSSGSTSAPKGVIGTQRSVNANLHAITKYGLALKPTDRAISWLPLYHDMGLIGFLFSPMYAQCSCDFLATSDFVRRPLLWLRLMTEHGATVTYSPSFGYDLASRRAPRAEDGAVDLSKLRIAGIGGDMVRPEALDAFTNAFASNNFNPAAFHPSYGMAEVTLAITFPKIGEPIDVDFVDMRHFNRSGVAQPASAVTSDEHRRGFVMCGTVLPDHDIEVRDEDGRKQPDRAVGRIFVKGPSLTPGYFSDEAATRAMYHGEWLDTGDLGYSLNGQIVITGRAKDLIIINGRNIWPQDIEWAVEKVPGVRHGGVAAFAIDDGKSERIVVVAERRGGMSPEALADMRREVAKSVQTASGAPSEVVLVRPHSMVMTSSGKLSRAKVKMKYLDGAFDDMIAEVDAANPKALAEARV